MRQNLIYIHKQEFGDSYVGLTTDGVIFAFMKDEANINFEMQKKMLDYAVSIKNQYRFKAPLIVEFGDFVSLSEDLVHHSTMAFQDEVLCVIAVIKKASDRILIMHYERKYEVHSDLIFVNSLKEGLTCAKDRMSKAGILFP